MILNRRDFDKGRFLNVMYEFILAFFLSGIICFFPAVPAAASVDPNRQLTASDIPDPILFHKLCELVTGNPDGPLTIGAIGAYTGGTNGLIDLSNLNITNIKGLGYAKGVKSIDLRGNNITLVPDQTFIDCTNLASVQLPDNVVSLGNSAFEGCSSLTNVNLPDGLSTIGEKCFLECKKLSNINLPMTITTIGNSAFSQSGLTSIIIPKPNISLGVSVFNGCDQLVNVTLPQGMQTIPMECFKATSKLSSIVLPQSINTLQEGAFSRSGLSGSLNLSAYTNLVSIKTSAFSGTSLSDVILPNSLTELGERAFENCALLKTITISSEISVLNQLTFSKCTSLQNVVFLPSGQENGVDNYKLQEIMDQAFYGCTGLSNVQFLQKLNKLTTIGNRAFAYCSDVIKDIKGKEVLDDYGLKTYFGIQSIILPQNLVTLGDEAFSNCYSLQTMTIPDKITTLEDKTFQNCYNLQTVKLSSILTTIGANCFENCKALNDLTFPASLSQIGSNAFLNCANEKVKSTQVSGKTVREYTYTGISTISLPDNLSQIGDSAFKGCFNLIYVKLPANLSQLNNSLFDGCAIQRKDSTGKAITDSYQGLKSVTFPASLNSIGNTVFRNCYAFDLDNGNLGNVSNSASVKAIGSNAFENCYTLKSVVIPSNLESIGSSAFLNSKQLEKVDFNNAVNLKTIGSSAFRGCAIEGIVRLPESLTKVENSVFQDCVNITSVEFPDGLTSIGSLSFNNCSSLTGITMPAAATIVYTGNQTSFRGCNDFTNAMIKAVPPDCSLTENTQAGLPVKCFNEIISAEVDDENVATAQITTDSKLKIPQVVLSGVKEGQTKVIVKGTIQYETGKDSHSEPTINMFQTSVEFNVIVTAVKCTNVEFSQPVRGLKLSDTKGITLNPTITPAGTTDLQVWTSDNESVAKVSAAGVVTPISYGTAIIKLKVGDQPEAQCQVNVCVPASSLSLDKSSLTMDKGDKITLNETVNYSSDFEGLQFSYPEVIYWTSSNNNVATVDQNGTVTALANGDTVITVKADAAGITRNCKISVVPTATKVTFDKNSIVMQKGQTAQIKMTFDPIDLPISQVKIVSSDSNVASVSVKDNIITVSAKKGGTAQISAEPVNGNTAACSITVNSPLTSLTTTPMIMKKGETRTISLVKTPSDATDILVYKSNNLKVAKVDSDGKVTAVEIGSTTITISTKDGLLTTECPVSVQVTATAVLLNLKKASVERNHTLQLIATIKPNNVSNKNVKWSSSNPNIATVDSNGLVTAVREGRSKITAKAEDGNRQASCSVTVVTDTTPPKIISITPGKSQRDVSLSQDIIVKFDEAVTLLSRNNIQLLDTQGDIVDTDLSTDNTDLVIHPKENLKPGEKYTLNIQKDAVEDLFENKLKSAYKTWFSTIKQS